jgi:hypothetical protein
MKAIHTFLFTILGMFLISSCEEKLDINLEAGESRIVIEGMVTDQPQPFMVKVSRTISFTQEGLPPGVDNASVTITDNLGNTYPLSLVSNGLYQTAGPEQGVVGRTYSLEVAVDGETYTAQDLLRACPPIDSMYSIYREISAQHDEAGYYAYASSTDPQNEENYYLYKFYKNGINVGDPNEVYINDDRFLSGNITGVELPGIYEENDTIRFEQYTMTRKAFLFYYGLQQQLFNDGGFFSTPPANAQGNISNGGLGLFQASGLAIDSLVVKP